MVGRGKMESHEEKEGELDQVFCFLKDKRKVEASVCETFRDEMMDFTAVRMASDHDFHALGLTRRGDILALRSFVVGDEKEAKKRKLLELTKQLSSKSSKKKTGSASPRGTMKSSQDATSPPTQRFKKIQIGWMHFSNKENRYVAVRMAKGGGTREVSFPLQATSADMMDEIKIFFFPDGMSVFGTTNAMTFKLGNFSCQEINEEFTLERYIEEHKLSKVRLYILSRISTQEKESEVHENSDDDNDLLTPAFDNATSSRLVGSSEERRVLRALQEKEYLDSLAADQAKESEKQEELLRCQERASRQERLRQARASRLSKEPEVNEPHFIVSVRHPIVGVQTRRFERKGEVGTVYDWVGSLSLTPEYFTLSMPDNANLHPSVPIETVHRVILSMCACEEGPAFPDEDVCFQGFGGSPEDSLNSTAESNETMDGPFCISELPPSVLMEGDEMDSDLPGKQEPEDSLYTSDDEADPTAFPDKPEEEESEEAPLPSVERRASRGYQFRQRYLSNIMSTIEARGKEEGKEEETQRKIPEKRTEVLEKLADDGETRNVTVKRADIVVDMLNLYSDNNVTGCLLNFHFLNEPALDFDGVKREAFTLFWEKVLPIYFDGTNSYVPRISPDIEETMYTTLGRILSHGFLMVGVFPRSLNKVFFTALITGKENVSDPDFLEGLLDYVSYYDSLRLQEILGKCNSQASLSDEDIDFLLEFLSEFSVSKMPNANNIETILVSVAKTELWNKVVMAADAMKKGILEGVHRELWLLATKELVLDLYTSLNVTAEKVLKLITVDNPDAMTKGQQTVYMYFRRYVRSLNEKELACLLRYVTGSSSLAVETIKVIFHAQVGNLPHVSVHACSGIVDLPSSGYESFPDFRSRMAELLNNADSWKFSLA